MPRQFDTDRIRLPMIGAATSAKPIANCTDDSMCEARGPP